MAKSGWQCERCKYAGVIEYDASADVYTVFNLLDNAHVTANGGACTDAAKIRVWEIAETTREAEGAEAGTHA